ncbi:MAG: UPF0182 family protein [Acidimicrobiales bacterium]
MRAPDDLPRRRRRRRGEGGSGRRRRVILIVSVVALFFLLTSLRGIAGIYTDYLWFDSLGQWGTRRSMLVAQASLALIFITAFFLLAWTNLYVAERLAPPFRSAGPEDELLERYHDLVAGRMGRVRVAVAGLLALIAGSGASGEWNSWILFTNGGDFGIDDPQFGWDVGFYVFRLPFLSFVVDWLFASLLIVLIITAVAHYLNGGIRVQSNAPRVTSQVKAHLSVLLAVLALVKTADYWLQRFELTVSSRGVVDGATYTDVHAQLPALNLLALISVAAAALFIANIFRRGWALPIVAVALWGFVAVAVGGIYPQVVQNFTVQPNESAKERLYIDRNIEATRAAMGVEDVTVRSYAPQTDADQVDVVGAAETIRNIRLWDPSAQISGQVFEQMQRIRDYYRIDDIDVDRYMVDGEMTQVELGVRSIDEERVPGDSWENEHLGYTHGYGVVLAPVNASVEQEPDYLIRDIPVQSEAESLTVDEPRVYFGEGLGGYAMVNTRRDEIDYEDEEQTRTTTYEGEDGVSVGSVVRRAAFALRFGSVNPLISDFLTGDSRVIFNRDVVDRVETLAPFLHADADPYPVLLDGEVVWVVDLYTTTSRYPYGQEADNDEVSDESGLDHNFNYVRNSVKATVDAYDGTVRFYVMDTQDPILDAYRDAFPDLFSDRDEMPEGLEAHLRYPEDLFRVQTAAWQRYHLSDAQEFYNESNTWRIARDPGTAGAESATPVTDDTGEVIATTQAPIAPYYQYLQLPDQDAAEFVLMRPFVPFSEDDTRQQLTAYMAARMDPGQYGDLVVYEMPSGDLPDGPGLVAGEIQADEAVSDLETNLGVQTGGSNVQYGNLLMVPIDEALLYVQPFYLETETAERRIPRLERVIAVFGDQVVIENTLEEALIELFGEPVETQEDPSAPPGEGEPEEPDEPDEPTGSVEERAAELLTEARAAFDEAEQALREGDLGRYDELNEEGQNLLDQAAELLGGEAPPPAEPPADASGTEDAEGPGSTTSTTLAARPA